MLSLYTFIRRVKFTWQNTLHELAIWPRALGRGPVHLAPCKITFWLLPADAAGLPCTRPCTDKLPLQHIGALLQTIDSNVELTRPRHNASLRQSQQILHTCDYCPVAMQLRTIGRGVAIDKKCLFARTSAVVQTEPNYMIHASSDQFVARCCVLLKERSCRWSEYENYLLSKEA